jgi:hypothetical protein
MLWQQPLAELLRPWKTTVKAVLLLMAEVQEFAFCLQCFLYW